MADMKISTLGSCADDGGHLLLVFGHGLEGDALGGLGEGEDLARVLAGEEALGDDRRRDTTVASKRKRKDDQGRPAVLHGQSEAPLVGPEHAVRRIAPRHPVEAAVLALPAGSQENGCRAWG